MEPMFVTLDMSRLSGWLNAGAHCRVKRDSKRGDMQAGRAWVRRRRRMQSARRAPTVEAEGRARAERTRNMATMSVTPDVSKLSGWLNADAYCRAKGKHLRDDVRIERREGVGAAAAHAACRKGPDCGG